MFDRWNSIIPELKRTSRLCDIYFEESDIVKGFKVHQKFHPLERWRLIQSAIPKFFFVKRNSSFTSARKPLQQLLNVNSHENNNLANKKFK
ncbi:hypothetical protein OUZ56_016435 [Daphnia magna]|uniref:THAP-type domain-containing protein n=1 Tax=Daphnia magna TaxID=35525 RepID=A0ABR0AQI5_9CRUS|nr:hypothetical protein OUZ56_016435 [Daphnia magna]